jgi:hypothetical protein
MQENQTQTGDLAAVRSSRIVRRRATVCTMMRIPHDPQLPMYQIWNVVASNGRHLCECKSESAANMIAKSLNTPNIPDNTQ